MTGTAGASPAGAGLTLTDPDNPIYGPLTITIGLDGSATASAPNTPQNPAGVTSGSGVGQVNFNTLTATGTGTPVPDFGGAAISTMNIALTDPSTPAPEQSLFFTQVAEGVAGNIVFNMEFAIENTNSTAASVTLDFFSTPDGNPMIVDLMEQGVGSSLTFGLAGGETLFLRMPGTTDPIQVGYARLNGPNGVSGVSIFTRTDNGTKVTKAGVLAARAMSSFSTPVDTREANNIGLALVNPPGGSVTAGASNLVIRLYDESFQLLGTRNLVLGQGAHMAAFVTDPTLFSSVAGVDEMTGSLTVEADNNGVSAAVLLQDDDSGVGFPAEVPILTAFPVIDGRADTGAAGVPGSAIQDVQMSFTLPAGQRRVIGAIYRLYRGETVFAKYLRAVRGPGRTVESFSLPRGADLSRLSIGVQYIYENGDQGTESRLRKTQLVGRR